MGCAHGEATATLTTEAKEPARARRHTERLRSAPAKAARPTWRWTRSRSRVLRTGPRSRKRNAVCRRPKPVSHRTSTCVENPQELALRPANSISSFTPCRAMRTVVRGKVTRPRFPDRRRVVFGSVVGNSMRRAPRRALSRGWSKTQECNAAAQYSTDFASSALSLIQIKARSESMAII